VARLWGRLRSGLTPWRILSRGQAALPFVWRVSVWSEIWRPAEDWIAHIERELKTSGWDVRRGSPFDRWDLAVPGGLLASARILSAAEEHGAGKQLIRFSIQPHWTFALVAAILALLTLGAGARAGGAGELGVGFWLLLLVAVGRGIWEARMAVGSARRACASLEGGSIDQERVVADAQAQGIP
jgi:hypothetical protein